MKILIITNTHGDELAGLSVVSMLRSVGRTFSHIIANHQAFLAGKRFIDNDLNRVFGEEGTSHEHGCAKWLSEVLPVNFDIVLDLHSTKSSVKDTCIFVNDNIATRNVIDILAPKYAVKMDAVKGSLIGCLNKNQIGIAIEYGKDNQDTVNKMFYDIDRLFTAFEGEFSLKNVFDKIEKGTPEYFCAYEEVPLKGKKLPVENMVLCKKGTPISTEQVADEDFYPFLFGGDYKTVLGFKMRKLE